MLKKAALATQSAFLTFVENFGKQIFIGAATVYVAKEGKINTTDDLKTLAIAGALAGIVWALGKANNS